MFSPKQALLSAALCATLTAPSQASNSPDENTSTNSNTYSTAPKAPAAPWDIGVSNAAKVENQGKSLMSLPIWPLQQLSQIFVENDRPEAILALGLTSSHLTGSILGWKYPDPCQDEDTRINNPTIQQAIRVDLRNAINARADELATRQKASETQPEAKPKPKARLLAPWRELLGENASLHHLIWALQMLQPQNVARLRKDGLLEELVAGDDKVKALALAAHATEIFPEGSQSLIIAAALESSCPPSEYAARAAACKQHLFTEKMEGEHQSWIIHNALRSSCPVSFYAPLGAACKHLLFTEGMSGWGQVRLIRTILPLSDTQIAQLVHECGTRLDDDSKSRMSFITERAAELLAGK